jgi:hypothetical protein
MRTALGIALAANRLVAHLPEGEPWVRALTPTPDGDSWVDLADALSELHEIAGSARAELYVALMPPFASVRRLELPGVSEREAAQVTSRDPSRFLPTHGQALVVEVEGTGWRRASPFLLVVVPRPTIEAIGAAAQESGWTLRGVVPAQLAWASARASSPGPNDIVVVLESHVEIVRACRGAVRAIRRIAGAPEATTSSALRASAARHDVELSEDALVLSSPLDAAIAAAEAARVAGPALLPEAARSIVRHNQRRGMLVRFAAAAALLAVAGGLTTWGLSRERANVAAERARIHGAVTQARAVRESLAALNARLAAVRSLEQSAPHWSALVTTLADKLPSDAFLLSLSASGDTLHLGGGATRPAPVFDALAAIEGVRSVRPEGPIRQEVRAAGATSEHFVLAALLAPPSASSNAGDHRAPNGNTPGRRP